MKRRQYSVLPYLRHVRGFSLIELMVSLTIGLLISIAAFSAYLGVAGANKVTDAQGRMNEDAQAALSILTQQIRMAQNNPIRANRNDPNRQNPVYQPYTSTTFAPSRLPSLFSIRGCDGTFDDIEKSTDLDQLKCQTNASPDSIGISYEADQFNTIHTTAGKPTDCLGNELPPVTVTPPIDPAPYFVAENLFYIALSPLKVPNLNCNGNGGNATPQPLVENIEDLQLEYGTVSSSTSSANISKAPVAGYLTADEVSKIPAAPDDPPWNKVITIRICVLVRSERPVLIDLASARYIKCDSKLEENPKGDFRMRRAYSTTVVLRNRRL